MKAYVVNISASADENKTEIQLFGRLENQKSFAAIIPFTPYFYLKESDLQKAKNVLNNTAIEKTNLNKVKITRILDSLESLGFIERKRRGMTNIVMIKN